MNLKLATAAAALVIGNAAFADDNSVYLDQVGGQSAIILQTGDNNQVGTAIDNFLQGTNNGIAGTGIGGNSLNVTQTGDDNIVRDGRQVAFGAPSSITLTQIGDDNRLGSVSQSSGGGNVIDVDVTGNNNGGANLGVPFGGDLDGDGINDVRGLATTAGESALLQGGNNNTIDANIIGDNNFFDVRQSGDENSVGTSPFDIAGGDNVVRLSQDGINNLISGLVSGSFNAFQAAQTGNDNVADITQQGNGNSGVVIQTN